jgi:hypothetical protein
MSESFQVNFAPLHEQGIILYFDGIHDQEVINVEEVDRERCENFIKNFNLEALVPFILKPTQRGNSVTSSYRIKHIFEELLDQYFSNGEFIYKMIRLGYKYKLSDYKGCSNHNVLGDCIGPNLLFKCNYSNMYKALVKKKHKNNMEAVKSELRILFSNK